MNKISHFEISVWIRNKILTEMAMFYIYEWSDKYKIKCINRLIEDIKELKGYFDIDPRKFTLDEMNQLGFRKFKEESKMMLIPFWMYPFLIYYLPTEEISGKKHYHIESIDNDHRFGCLAYGIYPAIEKE